MKKSNLIASLIAIVAACAMPTAFAQQIDKSGFYVGASAGQFMFNCSDANKLAPDGFSIRCDDEEAFAARVNGGFRLNDYFAFEFGYSATDKMNIVAISESQGFVENISVPLDVSFSALDFSLLASYPLAHFLSVYGRAGISVWDSKAGGGMGYGTQRIGNIVNPDPYEVNLPWEDERGEDILYGIGFQLAITDNLNAHFDWTRMDVDYNEVDITTDTIMIGATYRF